MIPVLFKHEKISPYYFYLLSGSFVVALLVLVGSFLYPQQYRAYNTYFIDARYTETQSSVVDFSPQQLAEKTADNVKGIIESRNFLGRVLEVSGFENTSKARERLSKRIQVKKVGPQVLYVQIKNYSNFQDLEKMITSTTAVLDDEIASINETGSVLVSFNEVNNRPNIEEVKNYPFLNALLTFLAAIILGVSLYEFKKYIER